MIALAEASWAMIFLIAVSPAPTFRNIATNQRCTIQLTTQP